MKRPAPTASKAGTCLSMVNIGNVPVLKVPRHLHQSNYFQDGILEFDGRMGQCFSRFRPFHREVEEGSGRKNYTGETGKVNPYSHIPHYKYSWPLSGKTDLC